MIRNKNIHCHVLLFFIHCIERRWLAPEQCILQLSSKKRHPIADTIEILVSKVECEFQCVFGITFFSLHSSLILNYRMDDKKFNFDQKKCDVKILVLSISVSIFEQIFIATHKLFQSNSIFRFEQTVAQFKTQENLCHKLCVHDSNLNLHTPITRYTKRTTSKQNKNHM